MTLNVTLECVGIVSKILAKKMDQKSNSKAINMINVKKPIN